MSLQIGSSSEAGHVTPVQTSQKGASSGLSGMSFDVDPGRDDRILNLARAASEIPGALNLIVGVPMRSRGGYRSSPLVRAAKRQLKSCSEEYGPIGGLPKLVSFMEQDIYGANSPVITEHRVASVMTAGGTNALRVANNFIRRARNLRDATIFIPDLHWDNHPVVFKGEDASKLDITSIPYRRGEDGKLDFRRFFNGVQELPRWEEREGSARKINSVLVLQGFGHNPTGMDLDIDQWYILADHAKRNGILLVLDCAYHSLVKGFHEDMAPVRLLAAKNMPFIVCYSLSKRFSVYGGRCGMASMVCPDAASATKVKSVLLELNRTTISNPPRHAQEIALDIRENMYLRHERYTGLLRRSGVARRQEFVEEMSQRGHDFEYVLSDQGMFSVLPEFSLDHYQRLLESDLKIHTLPVQDGQGQHVGIRMNFFALSPRTMPRLCDGLASVL